MNTKGAQVVKKEMLSKYGQYILSSTNIAIKNIINRGACQKEDHSENEENSMIYSLEQVTNSP